MCVTTLGLIAEELVFADLPVGQPSRLVSIAPVAALGDVQSAYPNPVSKQELDELSSSSQTLSSAAGWYDSLADLSIGGKYEKSDIIFGTSGFFATLRLTPILGRAFAASDFSKSGTPASPLAVITYACWKKRFGGKQNVIGSPLRLGSRLFNVIGVGPKDFGGLRVGVYADVVVPFDLSKYSPSAPVFWVIGRLREKASLSQAQSELQAKWRHMPEGAESAILSGRGRHKEMPFLQVSAARHGFALARNRYEQTLMTLLVLASLLLIIAYVNVGSVTLSRTISGRPGALMKLVLGQSRFSMLVESVTDIALLLLAANAIASGISLVLAPVVMRSIWVGAFPANFRWAEGMPLTLTFLALSLVGSLFVSSLSIIASLGLNAPLQVARTGQIVGCGKQMRAFQSCFLILQTCLSLIVILSTAELSQNLFRVYHNPLGFDTSNVSLYWLTTIPGVTITDKASYYKTLLQNIRTIPEVRYATLSHTWPISAPPERVKCSAGEPGATRQVSAERNVVASSFFAVFGIPFSRGRDLNPNQGLYSEMSAIVSRSLALELFRTSSVVDRALELEDTDRHVRKYRIAGVVADASVNDPHESRPMAIYLSIFQNEEALSMPVLQVRMAPEHKHRASLTAEISRAVSRGQKEYVWRERTLDELVGDALSKERMSFLFSFICSIVSLVLSIAGVFGLASYVAGLRRREAALRVALGASLSSLIRQRIVEMLIPLGTGFISATIALFGLRKTSAIASTLLPPIIGSPWYVVTAGLVLLALLSATLAPFIRLRHIKAIDLASE